MNLNNVFEVDQARYITFEAVKQMLDPEVMKRIKSVNCLAGSPSADEPPSCSDQNYIFMGTCQLRKASHIRPKSVQLMLQEISLDGVLGSKFFLTLCEDVADKWQNNQYLKTMEGQGTVLILFQNIPHQFYKTGEIHFCSTVSEKCAWVQVKNYFSSLTEARYERPVYLTLKTAAAEEEKKKISTYAVVLSVIKGPSIVSSGRGHGIYLLVDPSCYENMVKVRDYRVSIFSASLAVFPRIEVGDIIRMNAITELRRGPNFPDKDFKVSSESALVIFPWNDQERPRVLASHFTLTQDDIAEIKRLKAWSLERSQHGALNPTVEPKSKIVSLSEIKPAEAFDLPCRLVEFLDEREGYALWVEDGTRCPLTTCSDAAINQPFNSQATTDICNDCSRICVYSRKQHLGDLKLERQMLLYLRDVNSTIQKPPTLNESAVSDVGVTQFEVKCAVELLPPNTINTIKLIERLQKSQATENEVRLMEQIFDEQNDPAIEILPLEQPLLKEQSTKKEPSKEQCTVEAAAQVSQSEIEDPIALLIVEASAEVSEVENSGIEREFRKDNHKSSGKSTEEDSEMKEITSAVSASISPPLSTPFRHHQLVGSDILEGRIIHSDNPISLKEMNFRQMVDSTPKVSNGMGKFNSANQSSFSQEQANIQQVLFGTTNAEKNPSPHLRCPSSSISHHSAICIVDEVPETKSNCSDSEENDFSDTCVSDKVSRRVPTYVEDTKEDIFLTTDANNSVLKKNTNKMKDQITPQVSRSRSSSISSDDGVKNGEEIEDTNKDSDSDSVVQLDPETQDLEKVFCATTNQNMICHLSQDSDTDSVVSLDTATQDLEKLFCAVEEAHAAEQVVKHLDNLAQKHTIKPGERFRITARISELLPKQSTTSSSALESLLVAFCEKCNHLWQYYHFIDSISRRVNPSRNPFQSSTESENDDFDSGVINYLCDEEEHDRNMHLLAECENPDILADVFEIDENVFMDRSYVYICPMCKSRGIPDTLCALKPSFFFWLHATENIAENSTCLHILASGRHAEYFLGTKADHVLRSQDVWKRAEQRVAKLVQSKQPMTLALRRYKNAPDEIYLEYTKNVYSNNHLLPW